MRVAHLLPLTRLSSFRAQATCFGAQLKLVAIQLAGWLAFWMANRAKLVAKILSLGLMVAKLICATCTRRKARLDMLTSSIGSGLLLRFKRL